MPSELDGLTAVFELMVHSASEISFVWHGGWTSGYSTGIPLECVGWQFSLVGRSVCGMSVESIAPLSVQITGKAVGGDNPGWSGQVLASMPFAALLLIRNAVGVWWGKPEVAGSGAALSLLLHTNADGTAVQFLYNLGYGGVHEVSAKVANCTFHPLSPTGLRFQAGELHTFCTIGTEPVANFELLFLSRTNVYAGRTGVWRPHKRLRGTFPAQLELALFGPRRGVFLQSGMV